MKKYKVSIELPTFITTVTASNEEEAIDTAFQVMHYEQEGDINKYDIEAEEIKCQ